MTITLNNLDNISKDDWKSMKISSEKTTKKASFRNCWYNLKFYKNNPPNDGDGKQCYVKNNKKYYEVPYERNPFHESKGRFSLKNKPVAYFSNDHMIVSCETIPKLRKCFACSSKEYLIPYYFGETDLELDYYGYLLPFRLTDDVSILNLRARYSVIKILGNYCSNIKELILSDNEQNYKYSQIIAEIAFQKGFDGIIYDSVREPRDIEIIGYNLVMFNEKKIRLDIFPKEL